MALWERFTKTWMPAWHSIYQRNNKSWWSGRKKRVYTPPLKTNHAFSCDEYTQVQCPCPSHVWQYALDRLRVVCHAHKHIHTFIWKSNSRSQCCLHTSQVRDIVLPVSSSCQWALCTRIQLLRGVIHEFYQKILFWITLQADLKDWYHWWWMCRWRLVEEVLRLFLEAINSLPDFTSMNRELNTLPSALTGHKSGFVFLSLIIRF